MFDARTRPWLPAAAGHPLALAAAAFVLGLGLGCGQPLSMILSFNAAPPGRSAEAIAMRLAVSYGAHVVIPPVFGVVGAATGLAPIFWTCAVLLCGGAANSRPWEEKYPLTPEDAEGRRGKPI